MSKTTCPNFQDASRVSFKLDKATFAIPGKVLLHPSTIDFPGRGITALIGHNGSGKSTLLKLLGRHLRPSSGTIQFAGQHLSRWSDREFARNIACLPQTPPIAAGILVRELVALGRYPWHGALGRYGAVDRSKVEEAIEVSGIGVFVDREVETLSGGERQRCWLAMLIAQDVRCLLLDEPISALDIAHQIEVLSLVQRLCDVKGLAAIVVLHDINMAARYADQIVAMHSGRIVECGRPAEIMNPETLESIYAVKMDVLLHPRENYPIAVAR